MTHVAAIGVAGEFLIVPVVGEVGDEPPVCVAGEGYVVHFEG